MASCRQAAGDCAHSQGCLNCLTFSSHLIALRDRVGGSPALTAQHRRELHRADAMELSPGAGAAVSYCTGPTCSQTGTLLAHAPSGNGMILDAFWFGG